MKICCIPPAGLKSGKSDAYRALLSKTYSVCRADTQIITKPLSIFPIPIPNHVR